MNPRDVDGPLPDGLALTLVTATSAAVLVVEILAGRMLAPYVGADLETYTAIIGTILAGIALGARAGGAAADRFDARRLIPMLLVAGGALTIASVPVVRGLGSAVERGGGPSSVLIAVWAFLPGAAVLSAVPPVVVALQLRDLDRTGSVVGRLSAWGTGGAIMGTFLAGFVLVAYAAVTTLIVTVGLLLVAGGAVLWLVGRRLDRAPMLGATALVALSLTGVAAVDTPCDARTTYYCVAIEADADPATGRVLVLDDLRHSYVDLADPTHLEFWYVRRIADAIDVLASDGPLDVVALGGGGLTVPRWVDATRPGSRQVVLELDDGLVELVRDELPLPDDAAIDVRAGDARVSMRAVPDDSADVIVGDAFGSRAVPWHLATAEFADELARVLRPGGIYVANIIDAAAGDFLMAEAATLRTALPHVAVIEGPNIVDGLAGNSVLVASDRPVDDGAWDAARRAADDGGRLVSPLAPRLDDALVLTDDFAPVDQLLLGAR